MTGVSEFAPAKVNLCLHITGRRPDGYHLLDSIVAFADVGDDLSIGPANSYSLDIAGPYAHALSDEPDNLITRAARELGGDALRAAVQLEKRLPVAGGIGGGSANAAAALRGLMRLSAQQQPSSEALGAIALRLGADVPACLVSSVLRMRGIGELIDELDPLPRVPAILVNPGIPVPTGPIFTALALEKGASAKEGVGELPQTGFRDVTALAAWLDTRRNDLQPPAISLVPELNDVLATIRAQRGCLLSRMSGSGATCFGLFETTEAAQRAAEVLKHDKPEWWSVATVLS